MVRPLARPHMSTHVTCRVARASSFVQTFKGKARRTLSSPQLLSIMSSTSTPSDSPASVHIQPLHNPQNAAHVAVPQAPLGNATNGPINHAPGMGARALLVKRMTKTQ
jgi:hypothetical protein